jgi:hypothetical protein
MTVRSEDGGERTVSVHALPELSPVTIALNANAHFVRSADVSRISS